MKKLLQIFLLSMLLNSTLFANSNVIEFVTRFYTTILDRNPDSSGLNNWVEDLESGRKSGADIAKGFISSPEFINRDVSDTKYLEILYKSFFNREGDSGGIANWMDKLDNGASKSEILDGFLTSQEFINLCNDYGIKSNFNNISNFVTRFYTKVLDRNPDITGLNNWVEELESGAKSGSDIAYGFIFSTEFKNRDVDNEEYLDILYKSFFNRDGDVAGIANWMNKLNNGSSKEEILDGFLASQEFVNLCDSYGIKATNKPNPIQDAVDRHNEIRGEIYNGSLIKWSDDLANSAKDYANYLASIGEFKHDNSDYGENLFLSSYNSTYVDAINSWYEEKFDYNYQNNSCNGVCGHYTQMIWANSTELGCAKAIYSTGNYKGYTLIICRYNPAGNYIGEKPY